MWAYEIRPERSRTGPVRVERPRPDLGPRDVLVRVRAASLNARDLQVLDAWMEEGLPPLVPLSDGAGEVVATGDSVTRFRPGDRVVATFFQTWSSGPPPATILDIGLGGDIDGVLAECVAFSEDGLVRLPDHLSFVEGATLPVAALTAWHALVERGGLRAGESVLVLGTGGVSIFALQFARLHGARVVVISSSDDKLQQARELGADETVNYRDTADWGAHVAALTGGVDHVVEVGGTGTLARSIQAVKVGGRISLIGALANDAGDTTVLDIIKRSVTLQGIYVGSREMFEAMNRAISYHQLRPVIDRTFPLAELDAAFAYLRRGAHFGKVVVDVSASTYAD